MPTTTPQTVPGPHVAAIVDRFCGPQAADYNSSPSGPVGDGHYRHSGFVAHPDPAYGDSSDYIDAIEQLGGWTLICDLGCWRDAVVYHLCVRERALLSNIEGDIAVDVFATHDQLEAHCLALADPAGA